jgi:DNA-binding CsgD family transcriptional regulator
MLVGRATETTEIERLLAAAREGRSGVLVLRGEAGIGKSALLEEAVEQAAGFTVLRGTGIQSESELAYSTLHQILRPILDRIDELPDPQAAALRAAFALSAEQVDDRFRVSLGVLTLFAAASDRQPVLCLVDDAQWLDRASADALVFVARRLGAESLALLFAARDDDERQFATPGLPELRLSPLSTVDARQVVRDQLGTTVGTTVVEWVADNANGNPLALAELPATLSEHQLTGEDPIGDTLPATSLEQLYLERVKRLPESAQSLLLLAAAEETGTRATVERAAAQLGLDIGELSSAEAAGLLRVDAGQIAFRHPLVRSAVYGGAAFTDRERAHRTLAVASVAEGSADRAAWHRAAATVGTDEEVARELEDTAERARLRSGHAAAAAALERAAALSPDPESQARRLVGGAKAAWHAGQPERATALLDRASPTVADPWLRADIAHVRGEIGLRRGVLLDACAVLMAGAEEIAPFSSRKALEMLFDAANAGVDAGDYARVAEAGRRAAALPDADDERQTFLADLLVGVGSLIEGKTAHEAPRVLDAIARADDFDEPRWLCWAGVGAGAIGDAAREAVLMTRAAALARASGAADALTLVHQSIAVEGVVAGRYADAAAAGEGLKLAADAGLQNAASIFLGVLAWFAAVNGRDDECRAYASEVAERTRANGVAMSNSLAQWGLALLDLSRGRLHEAIGRLEALRAAPPGVGHPYIVLTSSPDLVEACVRAGQAESARAAYAILGGFARPGAPSWALALAARCRAMLAEGRDAEGEFTEAVRLHAESDRPFDGARTELLYGECLRRDRRRSDARAHLRAAVEAFEDLGAEPWAERARAELRATGETARKRDPSTLGELTPQELQIARLVADGGSNKQIAAQLFLSPRTIDYHLRKVFMKLAISSRAELIRHGVAGASDRAERELAFS